MSTNTKTFPTCDLIARLETAIEKAGVPVDDLRQWEGEYPKPPVSNGRLNLIWLATLGPQPESGRFVQIRDAVRNVLERAERRELTKRVMAACGYEYAPFSVNGLELSGWHSNGFPLLVFPGGLRDDISVTRAYLAQVAGILRPNDDVVGRLYLIAPNPAIPFIGDYFDVAYDDAAGGHFRFVFAPLPQAQVEALLAALDAPTTPIAANADSGAVAEGPDEPLITLRMPQSAWDVLSEALAMDCASGWLDAQIKADIARALAQVEEMTTTQRAP